ncbi:MAG: homoserine O-acetyltransferase [Agarilytica sp.]
MNMIPVPRIIVFTLTLLIALPLFANTLIVEKKRFVIESYKTEYGATLSNVQFGYETYGKLNKDKSNAILIPHYFSGTSHVAGKYSEKDTKPGYWDTLVGPGKAIDTSQFFVIGVDSLTNVNALNERVYTTGPTTINPSTQKPYGMTFPPLTTVDLARVQKALIEQMGITTLFAAIGISGGSVQSMQWAATYPEAVERIIGIVPPGLRLAEYAATKMELWTEVIKLDPNWNNGNYYDKQPPIDGLKASLKIMTVDGMGYRFTRDKLSSKPIDNCNAMNTHCRQNEDQVMQFLEQRVNLRTSGIDPNSVIAMVDTYQTFDITDNLKELSAKFLFIICEDDRIFQMSDSLDSINKLAEIKKDTEVFVFSSDYGHLGAILDTGKFASKINSFLR